MRKSLGGLLPSRRLPTVDAGGDMALVTAVGWLIGTSTATAMGCIWVGRARRNFRRVPMRGGARWTTKVAVGTDARARHKTIRARPLQLSAPSFPPISPQPALILAAHAALQLRGS